MSTQKNEEITYDPKTDTYEISGETLKEFNEIKKFTGIKDNEKVLVHTMRWFLNRFKNVEVTLNIPKGWIEILDYKARIYGSEQPLEDTKQYLEQLLIGALYGDLSAMVDDEESEALLKEHNLPLGQSHFLLNEFIENRNEEKMKKKVEAKQT